MLVDWYKPRRIHYKQIIITITPQQKTKQKLKHIDTPDPNRGSGIFANATVSMSNLVILDNYAWKGGGLYVLDHTVTATNMAMVNNYAEYRGGGVRSSSRTTISIDI